MNHIIVLFSLLNLIFAYGITLTNDNFILLKGEINEESSEKFINDTDTHNYKYIVIDSPGGRVDSGFKIISQIHKKQLICIAINRVASIAFAIFESCDTRYILENTILFQHFPNIELSQTYDLGEIEELYSGMIDAYIKVRDVYIHKLKVSDSEYKLLTKKGWTIDSKEAININAADKIINIKCKYIFLKNGIIEDTSCSFLFDKTKINDPVAELVDNNKNIFNMRFKNIFLLIALVCVIIYIVNHKFNYNHEIISKKTSSRHKIMGFDSNGNIVSYKSL